MAMSDNPQSEGAGGIIRYFVTDHLGSTTRLINADGTDYSETEYLSWGIDDPTPADIGTSFKYTGQRQAEAGLYFYNARWYDPEVGRFIQADSIIPEPGNPLAWDRYAYGLNNPIINNDPTGHCSICIYLVTIPVVLIVVTLAVFVIAEAGVINSATMPDVNGLTSDLANNIEYKINETTDTLIFTQFLLTTSANYILTKVRGDQVDDDGEYDPDSDKENKEDRDRRTDRQAQDDEFQGAVQEINQRLGTDLNDDEVAELHNELHNVDPQDYWGIVEIGLDLFDN